MKPRALVLRSSGTNCEGETVRALELAGARTDLLHLTRLAEDKERLADYSILVIAGGFSYGDDVAAGRVFGLELRTQLAAELTRFVDAGGHVLGVCNGFQILVESGIFQPGKSPSERDVALYANASNHYECRWVTMVSEESACAWLPPGEKMYVPVAHAEGRFVVRDEAALNELRERRQIALRYVTAEGAEAEYPDNPNGSVHGIAGICDPTGRVLGLMPHPERNLTPYNHPYWTRLGRRTEGEGLAFYRNLVEAAAGAPV